MKYFLTCLGAFALFLNSCSFQIETKSTTSSHISLTSSDDRFIAAKTVVGYFNQFIWGDYFYAEIETERKEKILFFIDGDEHCFLAENSLAKLSIDYDIVERYIPEAGGYSKINLIKNVRTESSDLESWQRSITPSELKKCRENSNYL